MKLYTRIFFFALTIVTGLTSCTNDYGDKVAKDFVEVYYKNNISKEQAQQTLDLFYPGWNESKTTKSVQLTKTGDTVCFRMVIDKEKAKDIKDETYLLMANGISASIFKGLPVNVDLTTNTFKTIRTLHFKEMDTDGELMVMVKNSVKAILMCTVKMVSVNSKAHNSQNSLTGWMAIQRTEKASRLKKMLLYI